VGGATGEVGDPSGRTTERPVLPLAQLHANVAAITTQLHRIAHHAPALWAKQAGVGPGAQPLAVVNNRDFYAQMDVMSFLRDVGRHARVASMLAKDRCAATTTTTTHTHTGTGTRIG
jgi:tyrosyl-tRNA synthetase